MGGNRSCSIDYTKLPKYSRQDKAAARGLVNGSIYKLPADGKDIRMLAVVEKFIVANKFNFTFDNSTGSFANRSFRIVNGRLSTPLS